MAKFIGIVLVLVIVLGFVVPSVFLSSSFAAERATTIAAEPASIAAEVNDFNTWESWTPWNLEYDATMKRTITGEPGAVGHKMAWTGDEGDGVIEITAVTPERTTCSLVFGEQDPVTTSFYFEPTGTGSTNVRWDMSGDFGGMPYERWFGLMMDGMIGADYEKGLANLKAKLEGAAAPAADAPAGE